MIITFDVLNTLQECARWVWLAGRAEDNLINGLTNTSNKAWPASKNWIYVCWQKLAICWSISTELNCCCGGGPGFQKSGQVYIWLDLQNSARTKEPVLMFFFCRSETISKEANVKERKIMQQMGGKVPKPGIFQSSYEELSGFEPGTFRSSVWRSPNWAISATGAECFKGTKPNKGNEMNHFSLSKWVYKDYLTKAILSWEWLRPVKHTYN